MSSLLKMIFKRTCRFSSFLALFLLLATHFTTAQRIFWTEQNNNRIMVGDLTPTSILNAAPIIPGISFPADVSLDPGQNYIFYTEQGGTGLIRRNYDGTSPLSIRDYGAMTGFMDVAYSENAGGVFGALITEEHGATFVPEDGSTPLNLPLGSNGNDDYVGVAVDDGDDLVYLLNNDNVSIFVTDFGGNIVDIIPITALTSLDNIAIDLINSKIFFSGYNGATFSLFSCNKDGSGMLEVVSTSFNEISSVQVYPQFNKVYYVANNSIFSVNPNGTANTQLINLPSAGIWDIAIEADMLNPILTSLTPADNTIGVDPTITELRLSFSEPVVAITTAISGPADKIEIFQDGLATPLVSIPKNSGVISFSGNLAIINIAGTLTQAHDYDVRVGSFVFKDLSGNNFTGVTTTLWNFSTLCVSFAPGTSAGGGTVCSGDDPALITGGTPTGGSGVYAYQWESSVTSSTGGFSDILGATGTNYDPPLGITQTTYFRRRVSSAASCTTVTENVITVNVTPPLVAGSLSTDQNICSGGDPAPLIGTLPTGASGAYNYAWESSTTSASTGFTSIAGAVGINYDPPTGLTQTTYYRRLDSSSPCASVKTNVITLTVLPLVVPGSPTGGQTLCAGGDPSILNGGTASGGNGSFTFQWESSITSPSAGFSSIPGAIGTNYDPPVGILQTTHFRRVVTSATCPPATSPVVTITVTPLPVIGTQPTPQTVCPSGQAAFGVAATGGGLLYQWQADNGSGFLDINNGPVYSGVTTNVLTVLNPIGLNGYRYRCVVKITTCQVISNSAALTVNPLPVVVDQTPAPLCESSAGATVAIFDLTTLNSPISGGQANRSVQWFTDGNLSLPAPTPSSTSVSNGSILYAKVANTTTMCFSQAKANFTVTPSPTASATPASVTICSGANTGIALSGASSFAWTVSSNNSVGGALPGSGNSINQTLTNLSSTQQQVNYSVIPSANGCQGQPLVIPVKIEAVPASFTATGGGSVCEGGAGVQIGLSNSQANVSYELLLNGQPSNTVLTPGGGAFNFPAVTLAGTYTIRAATATTNCKALMTGSATIALTVLPSGTGTITGNTAVACIGATASYKITGILNATSYQWTLPSGIRQVFQGGPDINLIMDSGTGGIVSVVGVNQCGNGGSAQVSIQISPNPTVEVLLPASASVDEEVSFSFTTTSSVQSSTWNFGDNSAGVSGKDVTHSYSAAGSYNVLVEITDTKGCKGKDSQILTVDLKEAGSDTSRLSDASIKNVVTANGDSKNDHLYIENIEHFPHNEVIVIDRWGSEVFKVRGYNNDWDFTRNGEYVAAGNYVCIVRLQENGKVFKRTVTVIRGR